MPRRLSYCLASLMTAFLMAGCPLSNSTLAEETATDQLVGRPPAETEANGATATSGDAAASGTSAATGFEARLVAEFPDCVEPAQEAEFADRILALVNVQRAAAGLRAVTRNVTLEQEAAQYACEMIHHDFFDHVNPVTKTTLGVRADQFGYDYQVVGENLAAGQRSPEQAMADWMNSPSHRQNILDPRFTELGVGIRSGGTYGMYWVQEFGLPAAKRP